MTQSVDSIEFDKDGNDRPTIGMRASDYLSVAVLVIGPPNKERMPVMWNVANRNEFKPHALSSTKTDIIVYMSQI